jgi:hypothetical protein
VRSALLFAFLSVVLSVAGSAAFADTKTAPDDINARDPRLQEGQMFVVRLVPAGKNLDVLITGKKAAELKVSDLGLKANLFVGDKIISLTPTKNNEAPASFRLEALDPKASKLKLEIKSGADEEKFEFNQLR